MKVQQPLGFQKGLGKRREPHRIQHDPAAVVQPDLEASADQMALDVEPRLQPAPFVDGKLRDQLQHDRRHVELLSVRLQREAKREPVVLRVFQRGREPDRPLVQPERP